LEQDLYQLLGVPRNASQDDIKRAFRRLARTYHPDFNPEDPLAERMFREVQQAYEIVGDPLRRSQYDRHGLAYFRRGEGNGSPVRSPQHMVNDFIEQMLRREFNPRRRGEDLRYYLSITLEEAARGAERLLTIPREIECESCRGTGALGSTGKRPCENCEGLGEVRPTRGLLTFRRPCTACRATGYRIVTPCASCEGTGRIKRSESVKFRIPAGIESGQRLKLRTRGNEGHRGGDTGDMYVVIHIKDHEIFNRQGSELLADVPINMALAALGGELEIPTLQGRARITLPPGIQSGRLFRLRGQGMPRVSQPGRGDLHIRVMVETPTQLTEEQRRLFAEMARGSGPAMDPGRVGILNKIKSRLNGEG